MVNTGRADITDGRAFNHVADGKSLDSLVFGYASRAVAAAHKFHVATAGLVATAISSFSRLYNSEPISRCLKEDFAGMTVERSTIIQSIQSHGTKA